MEWATLQYCVRCDWRLNVTVEKSKQFHALKLEAVSLSV